MEPKLENDIASVLDRETQSTIENWLARVNSAPKIFRCHHAQAGAPRVGS
jgi:hypothetical protein